MDGEVPPNSGFPVDDKMRIKNPDIIIPTRMPKKKELKQVNFMGIPI